MVWMFISIIFASTYFTIPLSVPTDSQIHILSVFTFLNHGDDNAVSFLILAKLIWDLFFVSIYCDNFLSYIIEHRTNLPCYCPILFTLYFIHYEIKSSLLLVLKGCFLWLIVRVINISFHIHFPLFIYWKQNMIIIQLTCCRWSGDVFDMNL